MKVIAITTPKVTDEDRHLIGSLIESGIDTIHLRKPDSCIEECRNLLAQLNSGARAKIIVHDFPQLYEEFSLKGIHINRNIRELPHNYRGFRTRSCHTLEELESCKDGYDYLFLSPVFDSISKAGYKSGFTAEQLMRASEEGIIDNKTIALGGVTLEHIPYLRQLNFGGVAMIGGIYNPEGVEKLKNYIRNK